MDLMEIKLETYCRTCLSSTSELYVLESNGISMIQEFTSVQVLSDDKFSKMICYICHNMLNQFHYFKIKCQEVDVFLKKFGEQGISATKNDQKSESLPLNQTQSEPEDCGLSGNTSADESLNIGTKLEPLEPHTVISEEEPHVCNVCNKSFRIKRYLTQHLLRHNISKRKKRKRVQLESTGDADCAPSDPEIYPCTKCDKVFTKRCYLRKHMFRHKTSTLLNLPQNNNDEMKLENNEKNGEITESWSCKLCNKLFTKRKYLTKHLKRHKHFFCPVDDDKCKQSYDRISVLLNHIRANHDGYMPQLKCNSCEIRFFIQAELEQHEKREHIGGMCTECGIEVPQLRKHQRQVHTDFKVHSCSICDRKFKIKRNLLIHESQHTRGSVDARVVCNYCGLKVLHVEAHIRNKHTLRVEESKPKMTCRYCKQQFDSLSSLIVHSRTEHVKERSLRADNYACKLCDKKYMNIQGLRLHIRYVHSQFKPLECTICGHKSKTLEHSKLHMRVHTDERPFECNMCSRKFKSRGTLKDHKNTHTGERPHVCPICQKGFTQRSAMTTHLRMHIKSQEANQEC